MDAVSIEQPGNLRPPTAAVPRRHIRQVATALLLVLSLGLGVAVLGPFRPGSDRPSGVSAAMAQAQSGDVASNPIVGVWRLVDDIGDPLGDNYGLFHADGTYVNVGGGTTYLGVWRPTGEDTVEVLDVTGSLSSPGEEFIAGTQLTHTTYTYDPGNDTLAGVYSPTISDASGEVFISGAKYSVTGSRVDFESVAASTPTP